MDIKTDYSFKDLPIETIFTLLLSVMLLGIKEMFLGINEFFKDAGPVLILLGVLPHYSYFSTFFAIPYFMFHAFFDFLGLFVESVGNVAWIISPILLILWPITVFFVLFLEIILVPLWNISPVTLIAEFLLKSFFSNA